MHPIREHGFQHTSHSTPKNNTYGRNDCLTNHPYQGAKNRRHTYHASPSRLLHTDHDQ